MKRAIKNLSKKTLRAGFEFGQRLGVDILPRHFYSEIPSISQLRRETSWRRPFGMSHVQGADIESQSAFFLDCCRDADFRDLSAFVVHDRACTRNGEPGYGPVEANFLYAFIKSKKPRTIVQIGCGVSTAVILEAAAAAGYRPHITCVEPYPTDLLSELSSSGEVALMPCKVQDRVEDVQRLVAASDFLFVDSTHTLGPAGEVTRIVVELLPYLESGFAHFHDIVFPFDYTPRLLSSELFFAHETALLLAFLTLNSRIRLEMALSMLHHECAEVIARVMPDYRPAQHSAGLESMPGHFPTAAYLAAD